MSCVILRGHWCDIVLNVHVPAEVKVMIQRVAFRVCDNFGMRFQCIYVGQEDIFKLIVGNSSLNKVDNDNGVMAINLRCQRMLLLRVNLAVYVILLHVHSKPLQAAGICPTCQ
jgi:hypothetical protein